MGLFTRSEQGSGDYSSVRASKQRILVAVILDGIIVAATASLIAFYFGFSLRPVPHMVVAWAVLTILPQLIGLRSPGFWALSMRPNSDSYATGFKNRFSNYVNTRVANRETWFSMIVGFTLFALSAQGFSNPERTLPLSPFFGTLIEADRYVIIQHVQALVGCAVAILLLRLSAVGWIAAIAFQLSALVDAILSYQEYGSVGRQMVIVSAKQRGRLPDLALASFLEHWLGVILIGSSLVILLILLQLGRTVRRS